MAATGLYDDLVRLRPAVKLIGQIALASVIVGLSYHFEAAAVAGWWPIFMRSLSIPLSILWITGYSNTFNFMDGINGMSVVMAVVNFLFFAIFSWLFNMPALVVLVAILGGSCLGFLPHNFPRARTS